MTSWKSGIKALSFGASVAILIFVGAFMVTAAGFAIKWTIDEEIFVKGPDGGWTLNQEEAGERFKSGFEDTFGGFGDLSGFSGGAMSVRAARKLLNVSPGATLGAEYQCVVLLQSFSATRCSMETE